MSNELKQLLEKPTASVPDVGRICFGLSRNAAYEAARRGDIPTVRLGKILRVPTAWVRAKLLVEAA
jgi:hypothetical protein